MIALDLILCTSGNLLITEFLIGPFLQLPSRPLIWRNPHPWDLGLIWRVCRARQCLTIAPQRSAAAMCPLNLFCPGGNSPSSFSLQLGDFLCSVVHRTQNGHCQWCYLQLTFSLFYTLSLWGAISIALEKTVQPRLIGSPSKTAVWSVSLKIIEKRRGQGRTILCVNIPPC